MIAQLSSEAMARVCYNALAFLPARAQFQEARLEFAGGILTATATDSYTIGSDHCPYEAEVHPPTAVSVTRETLSELDKAGRADKKGSGTLEIGERLTFTPENGDPVALPWEPVNDEAWMHVDAVFAQVRASEGTERLPEVIAFDPSLLMRFSKVKADKAERIMDCRVFDPRKAVLVKIGPTFVGAIMPIDRDTHGANMGEDGLWSK